MILNLIQLLNLFWTQSLKQETTNMQATNVLCIQVNLISLILISCMSKKKSHILYVIQIQMKFYKKIISMMMFLLHNTSIFNAIVILEVFQIHMEHLMCHSHFLRKQSLVINPGTLLINGQLLTLMVQVRLLLMVKLQLLSVNQLQMQIHSNLFFQCMLNLEMILICLSANAEQQSKLILEQVDSIH